MVMKYSIVVIAYNEEKKIKRCLDSIIKQKYTNFELLLIDDGSVDDTLSIMNNYAERDKRIRVIQKKNTGPGDCKNLGIALSSGEYILFVDADDYIDINSLYELDRILLEKKIDLIVFKFSLLFEESNKKRSVNFNFNNESNTSLNILLLYLKNKLGPIGRNLLIRKSLLIEKKISFPNRSREDGATIYKIIALSNNVFMYDKELYYYCRPSGETFSTKFNIDNIFNSILNINEMLYFFEDNRLMSKSYSELNNFFFYILIHEYFQVVSNKKDMAKSEYFKALKIIQDEVLKLPYSVLNTKYKLKYFLFKVGILKKIYEIKGR